MEIVASVLQGRLILSLEIWAISKPLHELPILWHTFDAGNAPEGVSGPNIGTDLLDVLWAALDKTI